MLIQCYSGISQAEPLGWVITSESCALSSVSATFVREVLPGEILPIDSKGIRQERSRIYNIHKKNSFCIFEYVYFSSPASLLEGKRLFVFFVHTVFLLIPFFCRTTSLFGTISNWPTSRH